MLEPAMLHKEAIINGLKNHIYDNEMIFYSGWNGYSLPEFPNEFDGTNYRYAILDGDKVIGFFCYTYDMHSRCLRNFGLYSFDKGNIIIGKDILCEIRRIIKEYKPHRMEWRMVGGNINPCAVCTPVFSAAPGRVSRNAFTLAMKSLLRASI